MRATRFSIWWVAVPTFAAVLGLALAATPLDDTQTFTVLYSFAGYPRDGAGPDAGLLIDASGNLYGTTAFGGKVNGAHCAYSGYVGCGTVFRLDTKGVETVLHNFAGPDGTTPRANLIMGADGSLYGTTAFGGNSQDCGGNSLSGCGVVFKLSEGKETVLHRFTGGADGASPQAGLVMDANGILYGTTTAGGTGGGGVVFKMVEKKETVLHSFTGGEDGAVPASSLLLDAAGNLSGTDAYGGDTDCGCGVVFKLAGKHLSVLHTFKGPPDGANPFAGVTMDAEGDFYGTTKGGGESYSAGTVFGLGPSGKERVLHRFLAYTKQHDGIYPETAVVRDAQGDLYGTTEEGGLGGAGVVYEITANGKERILHSFCTGDCSDGGHPNGLIMDAQGNLYGTTSGGGVNRKGTIFKITLQPTQPQ